MIKNNIVIGCPISNREKFLPHYLYNLYNLNFNKKQLSFYFILNNSSDDSEKILLNFKLLHEHEYNNITIDYYNGNKHALLDERTNEIRLKYTYNHLSKLRNKLIFHAAKNDYSHLFSIDSDIMIEPEALNKLLSHNKDCIASLIWNGYLHAPNEPHKFPNILNYNERNELIHISNYYVKNAPNLKESKIAKVDCSGAIILISNQICQKVKYGFDIQGEDIYFSREVYKNGFEIFVDYSVFSKHLMNELMLEEYIENKEYVIT